MQPPPITGPFNWHTLSVVSAIPVRLAYQLMPAHLTLSEQAENEATKGCLVVMQKSPRSSHSASFAFNGNWKPVPPSLDVPCLTVKKNRPSDLSICRQILASRDRYLHPGENYDLRSLELVDGSPIFCSCFSCIFFEYPFKIPVAHADKKRHFLT